MKPNKPEGFWAGVKRAVLVAIAFSGVRPFSIFRRKDRS